MKSVNYQNRLRKQRESEKLIWWGEQWLTNTWLSDADLSQPLIPELFSHLNPRTNVVDVHSMFTRNQRF